MRRLIDQSTLRVLSGSSSGRVVLGLLAGLVAIVVVGLVVMWPGSATTFQPIDGVGADSADVERVERRSCRQWEFTACQVVGARLTSGPQEGETFRITLPGTERAPEVEVGDAIRVVPNDAAGGTGDYALGRHLEPYAFADFERRSPLVLLLVLFAVVVIAFGRWKGVRSLVGLAISLVVVTQFMVPAILDGSPPLPVAFVGALAVMLVTVLLAHGAGVTSIAAVLGATAALAVTAALALLFVGLAQITGFAAEEAQLVLERAAAEGETLSLQGLVLAGIVVAALGVLDDVTVSQASTVLALRRANPEMGLRRLYREALSVGRDHLTATVNTLVLAYVGAALPVLLIFETTGSSFGEAVNREAVAGQLVAMLVGSIGLVLAVPLTTALAAWLARTVPAGTLRDAGPTHYH